MFHSSLKISSNFSWLEGALSRVMMSLLQCFLPRYSVYIILTFSEKKCDDKFEVFGHLYFNLL